MNNLKEQKHYELNKKKELIDLLERRLNFNKNNNNNNRWKIIGNKLKYNYRTVSLSGFSGTTTEYIFDKWGIDTYWNYNEDKYPIINYKSKNPNIWVKFIVDRLCEAYQPVFRIPLNAIYWLADNKGLYTNINYEPFIIDNNDEEMFSFSGQIYHGLIDDLILYIQEEVMSRTGKDCVIILDLHWNDQFDKPEPVNQEIKQESSLNDFWYSVANRYKNNTNVWFEPSLGKDKNDRHVIDGKGQYVGMKQLYDIIRNEVKADNIILISGGYGGYAYYNNGFDISWFKHIESLHLKNIMFNLHPIQSIDSTMVDKSVDNFKQLIQMLNKVSIPLIVTDVGLSNNPGNYTEQIVSFCYDNNISWIAWSVKPNNEMSLLYPNIMTMKNGRIGITQGMENKDLSIKIGVNWEDIWNKYS